MAVHSMLFVELNARSRDVLHVVLRLTDPSVDVELFDVKLTRLEFEITFDSKDPVELTINVPVVLNSTSKVEGHWIER